MRGKITAIFFNMQAFWRKKITIGREKSEKTHLFTPTDKKNGV